MGNALIEEPARILCIAHITFEFSDVFRNCKIKASSIALACSKNLFAKPSISLNLERKSPEVADLPNKNLCGKDKH